MFDFWKKPLGEAAAVVTKDTIIGDILDAASAKGKDTEAQTLFMQIGMHCLGCPASRGETVEEACGVHGLNTEEMGELIEQLNGLLR